jgi:seryl-tRNA synthetase
MLDPRFVAENPDVVKQHLRRRHAAEAQFAAVDRVVACNEQRRALVFERDQLLASRNTLSREVGAKLKAGQSAEADAIKAQVAEGNARVAAIEPELATIEAEQHRLVMGIPNLLHADVPDGSSEHDNVVVRSWGTPRALDFEPKAHVEVAEALGILDLERAAKLSGSRFAVLRGMGAKLERALVSFFLDVATEEHGYTEVMVPYIVGRHAMEGTGQLPKFEEDMFKLADRLNGSDAFLIPTAEVPVTNLHRDEIIESELPIQYVAFTPCFRAEAGSAGRDMRGLIRTHQFHKVELVWITTPERADADHEALVRHAEVLLQRLELPYRVSLLCAADISANAHRCYDLEVWLPSQASYREVSSCSTFGEYQARRMQLRYRGPAEGGKKGKPRLGVTLNGSGLAVGRAMVAILENHQQADGSVVIPKALRPYLGGVEVLRPSA